MLKKLSVILLAVILAAALALPAFAVPDSEAAEEDNYVKIIDLISDKDTETTSQFLVTITQPNSGEETATKKTYIINGIAKDQDVVVYLARFNEKTGIYENYENADGEYTWETQANKMFSMEVTLNKDANKIKLVAYPKEKEGKLKLEDIQINKFTINFTVDKLTIDKLLELPSTIITKISNFFSPESKESK